MEVYIWWVDSGLWNLELTTSNSIRVCSHKFFLPDWREQEKRQMSFWHFNTRDRPVYKKTSRIFLLHLIRKTFIKPMDIQDVTPTLTS